jgi:hypothetical protein
MHYNYYEHKNSNNPKTPNEIKVLVNGSPGFSRMTVSKLK